MVNSKAIRILLVSSRPLSHSAYLAWDMRKALENEGCMVDFLSLEENLDKEDNAALGIDTSRPGMFTRLSKFVRRLAGRERSHDYIVNNGIIITNPYEDNPPVSNRAVASALRGREYNLVLTVFWQDMITSKSLCEIYRRIHAPILIYAVDNAPITGGCIYSKDCQRYKYECGCCPALDSNDPSDRTHTNWLAKKRNYGRIPVALLCNTWQKNMAMETNLLDIRRIFYSSIILDADRFVPMPAEESRRQLGICEKKTFVMLARATAEVTKGFRLLEGALARFGETLSREEKANVLLVLIGNDSPRFRENVNLPSFSVGFLDAESLVMAYSASDIFLSPSVCDAGPSMVNQSLMCGTPAVCFRIGTAMDVVHNYENGYVAEVGNVDDFAKGIRWFYKLDDEQRQAVKKKCREEAIKNNSYQAFYKNVMEAYGKMRKDIS